MKSKDTKMNEKLKEFAKEAGFKVPTNGIKSEDFDIMLDDKNVNTELEAFAKLIIQECIRIDIINWDAPPGDSIREYFEID
jgi:hypothetical protein